jgi:hypothetical protein
MESMSYAEVGRAACCEIGQADFVNRPPERQHSRAVVFDELQFHRAQILAFGKFSCGKQVERPEIFVDFAEVKSAPFTFGMDAAVLTGFPRHHPFEADIDFFDHARRR